MKLTLTAAIFLICSHAFALEATTIQEGAQQYDWQTCMDHYSNSCINDCATSEDRDCKNNCLQVAKDKCLSQGISPPTGSNEFVTE